MINLMFALANTNTSWPDVFTFGMAMLFAIGVVTIIAILLIRSHKVIIYKDVIVPMSNTLIVTIPVALGDQIINNKFENDEELIEILTPFVRAAKKVSLEEYEANCQDSSE